MTIEQAKDTVTTLLRKTEKYTKTDMVYLTGGGFWLFLKMAGTMAIAFGLSIAFANLLPPEVFGAYKYVFSIYGFLAIATLSGMNTAITRAVAQGYEGTPRAALAEKIRWGVLGSIGSIGLAGYYAANGNMELGGAFLIVSVFLPFTDTFTLFNATLNGKKLFTQSALYEIFVQAGAACALVTVLWYSDNLLALLGTYFVAYTLLRAIAFFIAEKRYAKNASVDPEAIAYGKQLSILDVPTIISETVDTVLMWQFIGPVAIATYAFAKGIPVQLSVAFQRVLTLAFPKFAARDFESVRGALIHKMLLTFGVMLAVVGAYILAAPYIFSVLFPHYMAAVPYSQLFSLTLLFFPQKFIGTMFEAHAKTAALRAVNTLVPIVRIACSLVLIPTLGILGALLSEFAAKTASLLTLSVLYVRSRTATTPTP